MNLSKKFKEIYPSFLVKVVTQFETVNTKEYLNIL